MPRAGTFLLRCSFAFRLRRLRSRTLCPLCVQRTKKQLRTASKQNLYDPIIGKQDPKPSLCRQTQNFQSSGKGIQAT